MFANLSVVDELKGRIGSHAGFVPLLYSTLERTAQGADAHRPLRLQTIRTLANLAVETSNRALVSSGLPVATDTLASATRDDIAQATLRLVVNLSYDAAIASAMLESEQLVRLLVSSCASTNEAIQQEVRSARARNRLGRAACGRRERAACSARAVRRVPCVRAGAHRRCCAL